MLHRLTLISIVFLLLAGCGSSAPEANKDAAAAKLDPSKFRDDPVVVADGSLRFLFRSSVFSTEAISPVYGCCLATPAVLGKKEVRIFRPTAEGSASVSLAQTLPLNEADVLQLHLERKGQTGWVPMDNDKFPTPQVVLFRRNLSQVDALKDAKFADYGMTGRGSWIVSAEMPIKAGEADPFAKGLSMRHQYVAQSKTEIRLGRVVIRRADNSSDTVTLANSCSAVEICSAPNCLAGMNSPCAATQK